MRLLGEFEQSLIELRQQAKDVPMINPQLTLAERLSKQLDQRMLTLDDFDEIIDSFTRRALTVRATDARQMLGVVDMETLRAGRREALKTYLQQKSKNEYHLVFTAHPIFTLKAEDAEAFSRCIVDQQASLPTVTPLQGITLAEEHARAMTALDHARAALLQIDRELFHVAQELGQEPSQVKNLAMNVSCWVGYDLDGRDDIRWVDSFCFRLHEKAHILAYYARRAEAIHANALHEMIGRELQATKQDLANFRAYQRGEGSLAVAANILTQRQDKVVDISGWVEQLGDLAKTSDNPTKAMEYLLLAREMLRYRLGIGEIHLRLNALQVRNAMRHVDGRGVSESRGGESSRQLIEQLNQRISALAPQEVNFHDLDTERATAVRLMMLSKQILKHVDGMQPIRLLVAECEQPLTLLSSLYLAKQFQVAERLDISPLFETRLGLERGAEIMEQLVQNSHYADYVKQRGRLCVQTGFSDAGRFIGQIPASLAIERLQIKIAQMHQAHLQDTVHLVIFNTHGESLGRGGARGSIRRRQEYIFSPHARTLCDDLAVPVVHESAFQGGDGYLWFGNLEVAEYMITRLFEAEFIRNDTPDPLYDQSDFALDVFLSIKNWHDALFRHPDYAGLLDLFGHDLLPKTGSRPSKRASSSMGMRQDPSKMRAIVHNARLQQLGYLANVVGGLGHASMIDADRFRELYEKSPRLRQLVDHALQARYMGSTASLLAYGTLFQRGFWINSAYQSFSPKNLRACRSIADALLHDIRSDAVRRLTTVIRDDLLDLRSFQNSIGWHENPSYPEGRLLIDSLQVVRLVLIIQVLFLATRVPRFAEQNDTGRGDLIRLALRLDIAAVTSIVEQEFTLHGQERQEETFFEAGQSGKSQRYQEIETEILAPMRRIHGLIQHISMVIGFLYGGHG